MTTSQGPETPPRKIYLFSSMCRLRRNANVIGINWLLPTTTLMIDAETSFPENSTAWGSKARTVQRFTVRSSPSSWGSPANSVSQP